jgi:hypothetical protein
VAQPKSTKSYMDKTAILSGSGDADCAAERMVGDWEVNFRLVGDPGVSGIVSFLSRPYSYAISRFKIVRVSNCEQLSHGRQAYSCDRRRLPGNRRDE